MNKNGRFMVGLVGVAAVVTYLIWTGVSETMVYYMTPVELIAKVEVDPSLGQQRTRLRSKPRRHGRRPLPGARHDNARCAAVGPGARWRFGGGGAHSPSVIGRLEPRKRGGSMGRTRRCGAVRPSRLGSSSAGR